MDISKFIDYTLLKATTSERDVINLCNEAKLNGFYAVCINTAYVALAKQLLENTGIKIASVIGFPLGATSTAAKVYEAKKALEDGADEIEMVMNLGFLKSRNFVLVLKDIIDVKLGIKDTPLKVILEISELSKNEIIKACSICLDAKVDVIKTSSGFSKSGATLTATKIIKKTIKDQAQIMVSGGIEDFETALKYLEAGADRIGTSKNINPVSNSIQNRNAKVYKKYLEANQIQNSLEIQYYNR
ncbi:deoxyribose-phosphate aldolase [Mariniflexile gromovii]|uniref:Deoxyribose-phosphate aldolase n=1 Tax=Mariniflexile gromovii TaxID=362523 RepID=A0ABS4BUH0_9FLAO|nr:deoxyribose-phosphate aldolase [Mariniflexile gromovii]MBP0904206.1 deoxyribose-phosphate aldolase [Mariniflexile gromovii]